VGFERHLQPSVQVEPEVYGDDLEGLVEQDRPHVRVVRRPEAEPDDACQPRFHAPGYRAGVEQVILDQGWVDIELEPIPHPSHPFPRHRDDPVGDREEDPRSLVVLLPLRLGLPPDGLDLLASRLGHGFKSAVEIVGLSATHRLAPPPVRSGQSARGELDAYDRAINSASDECLTTLDFTIVSGHG
jgi:hypothetical protein